MKSGKKTAKSEKFKKTLSRRKIRKKRKNLKNSPKTGEITDYSIFSFIFVFLWFKLTQSIHIEKLVEDLSNQLVWLIVSSQIAYTHSHHPLERSIKFAKVERTHAQIHWMPRE